MSRLAFVMQSILQVDGGKAVQPGSCSSKPWVHSVTRIRLAEQRRLPFASVLERTSKGLEAMSRGNEAGPVARPRFTTNVRSG